MRLQIQADKDQHSTGQNFASILNVLNYSEVHEQNRYQNMCMHGYLNCRISHLFALALFSVQEIECSRLDIHGILYLCQCNKLIAFLLGFFFKLFLFLRKHINLAINLQSHFEILQMSDISNITGNV